MTPRLIIAVPFTVVVYPSCFVGQRKVRDGAPPYIDMWAGTPRLVPGANNRFMFSADRFARLSTVKFDFPLNNYWPSFDDIKTSGKRVGQRDVHMQR